MDDDDRGDFDSSSSSVTPRAPPRGIAEGISELGTSVADADGVGVAEGRNAPRTTPERATTSRPLDAEPAPAVARLQELSAKQIKQLNSSKTGMIFKLDANCDFF